MAKARKSEKSDDGSERKSIDREIVPEQTLTSTAGAADEATLSDDEAYHTALSFQETSVNEYVERAEAILTGSEVSKESAMKQLGDLLLYGPLNADWEQVINGKPTKHPVFKEIVAHRDAKRHRHRYLETLRAAAVAREWKVKGWSFPDLGYSHRVELAKIKDQDLRFKFANDAQKRKLSVRGLVDVIKERQLTLAPPGAALAQRAIRQIKTVVDFMNNGDARALLEDPSQFLKLDEDSRMQILRYSKLAKKATQDMTELFGRVSDTIIENESTDANARNNKASGNPDDDQEDDSQKVSQLGPEGPDEAD
jgi:hypothetical protein